MRLDEKLRVFVPLELEVCETIEDKVTLGDSLEVRVELRDWLIEYVLLELGESDALPVEVPLEVSLEL